MQRKKYIVRRAHQGDQWYSEGDTRSANPNDVGHLIERGVLVEAKMEKPAKNKAAKVPLNKAAD